MKQRIICDLDGTVFNSPKAICKTYNLLYKNHEYFIYADHTQLKNYAMDDLCPLQENIVDLFETKLFFEFLEPFDNAIEVIKRLMEEFDVEFVSIGTPQNIKYKIDLIKQYFGKSAKFMPIISYDRTCNMEKFSVNANMAICIDDNEKCLFSFDKSTTLLHGSIPSNHNIVFGKPYLWNIHNTYTRCLNWIEVYSYIIALTHGIKGLDEAILQHNLFANFKYSDYKRPSYQNLYALNK